MCSIFRMNRVSKLLMFVVFLELTTKVVYTVHEFLCCLGRERQEIIGKSAPGRPYLSQDSWYWRAEQKCDCTGKGETSVLLPSCPMVCLRDAGDYRKVGTGHEFTHMQLMTM